MKQRKKKVVSKNFKLSTTYSEGVMIPPQRVLCLERFGLNYYFACRVLQHKLGYQISNEILALIGRNHSCLENPQQLHQIYKIFEGNILLWCILALCPRFSSPCKVQQAMLLHFLKMCFSKRIKHPFQESSLPPLSFPDKIVDYFF